MNYICSREEMQAVDHYSIHSLGIPGIVLMEKAALAMEKEILSRFSPDSSVFILAECGNNGGDGLALGRLLDARGFKVTICEIGGVKKPTDSYEIQKNILRNLDMQLTDHIPDQDYDIYIDAVFGVGLKREVTGIQGEMLQRINKRRGYKIAVDVPSGVDASNGHILGTAFQADLTITFGLLKAGLVLYPGASCAGEVVVKDIGFPDKAVEHVAPAAVTYDRSDLDLLPFRSPWSNKGTYGRVLLIAGSKNMAGAAFLSALGAYKSGSGLVRIFTCEENRQILQTLLPEAIMTTWHDVRDAEELLEEALSWADVVGIGPGVGQGVTARRLLMKVLEKGRIPLVIDADGLNNLAGLIRDRETPGEECRRFYQDYPAGIILTPHLKEMERLTGRRLADIKENLIESASLKADPRHIFVLKDARTVVSDGTGPVYINLSGNHGMAVGGSGDVLTGIICGFLAGGLPLLTAARLGVYCHGLAGDEAAAKKGFYGLMAKDIADYLYKVIH